MQDPGKPLRSIDMGVGSIRRPTAFVGLGGDLVVVGFHARSPLQVWDLAAGTLVFEFEGSEQWC